MLDEPEQLRRERRLRQRDGPVAADARRHLDDVVVRRGRRACRRCARRRRGRRRSPAAQRGDQAHRGLAVVRAAALLEQRRLLVQRRVAVQLQQPALDLGDGRGARHARRAARRAPRRARRSSAGSTTGPRRARRAAGAAARRSPASSSPCAASSVGEHVGAVDRTARTHVRWLRPTWSTSTRSGSTPSIRATSRWKPIATLQSPTARWPASSSARVTMPTGLVKSTIHAPAPRARHPLGDVQDHGHRAQRLGEAARAGRLLADAAAGERHGLVRQPRRLAADADLHQHEVGAVERASRSSVSSSAPAKPLRVEHPLARARRRPRAARRRCRAARARLDARAARRPETSSGVYVEPAPMTAIFTPSPPSASRPRRTPSGRRRTG